MLKVDVEIMDYIEKMVIKGTNINFEKVFTEGFDTPLIHITCINSKIKKSIIMYDYDYVKTLDDVIAEIDNQIERFNKKVFKKLNK